MQRCSHSCACLLLALGNSNSSSLPWAYTFCMCEAQNHDVRGIVWLSGHCIFPSGQEREPRIIYEALLPVESWSSSCLFHLEVTAPCTSPVRGMELLLFVCKRDVKSYKASVSTVSPSLSTEMAISIQIHIRGYSLYYVLVLSAFHLVPIPCFPPHFSKFPIV